MVDNINPDHYKQGGIETIEYMKAKMSKDEFYGYIKGNALKYISREGLKSEKIIDKIDDCKKAIWYLEQMIKANHTLDMYEKKKANVITKNGGVGMTNI